MTAKSLETAFFNEKTGVTGSNPVAPTYNTLKDRQLQNASIKRVSMSTKYKLPKLWTTTNEKGKPTVNPAVGWYVYYSYLDPATSKFKRFIVKENINTGKTVAERTELARLVVEHFTDLLINLDWNPFQEYRFSGPSTLFEDLIEPYFKEKIQTLEPRNALAYKSLLNKLLIFCNNNNNNNVQISNITRNDIKEFLNKNSTHLQWKPKTYNHYLQQISHFFLWVTELDNPPIKENPTSKLKPRAVLKEGNPPFTDSELRIIMNYAQANEPYFYFFYNLLYYTCLRPTKEARLLKVGDIDFSINQINLKAINSKTGKKTGKGRTIPIADQLLKLFKSHNIENHPVNYYVFTKEEKPGLIPVSEKYFSKIFNKIKLSTKLNKDLTMYAIKHTRVCHMVIDKVPLYVIQRLTGHTTLAQLMDYLKGLNLIVDQNEPLKSRDI